MGFLIVFSKVY